MYDTNVTIVGNALHEPEWRRTANTGASVTTFKIASTARRLNRETGKWVDGNSLRVRVVCWRSLAVNVAKSVTRGDPLIVSGRLYTRDWTDAEGMTRTQYELEATAVGHDLTRGRSVFERVRPRVATSVIEDNEAEQRIGGELTELVPPEEAPVQFDDTPYEVLERDSLDVPATPVSGHDDPMGTLRGAGFSVDPIEAASAEAAVGEEPHRPEEKEASVADGDSILEESEPAEVDGSGRRRGFRRSKVSA